jgi:hypothetical protein
MEISAFRHSSNVEVNWILRLLDDNINSICGSKVLDDFQESVFTKNIFFGQKNRLTVTFDFLLEHREEIFKEASRIIDRNYGNQFFVDENLTASLCTLMNISKKSKYRSAIKIKQPEQLEIINYIIQLYICINILVRHTTETKNTHLLFDKYNGYLAKIAINFFDEKAKIKEIKSVHDLLFYSNLTINFLDEQFSCSSTKTSIVTPKEILSIIIEYDELIGERLLEPGVEDLIYQRVRFS